MHCAWLRLRAMHDLDGRGTLRRPRPRFLASVRVATLAAGQRGYASSHGKTKMPPRLVTLRIAALAALVMNPLACQPGRALLPSCPPGAILMGSPPPKGEEVWCQKIVAGKAVKHGVFIAYGTGGLKMIEGAYHDGMQEGEWTTWYENGERSAVDHYTNGLQNGLHTSWYANGVKAIEGEYRNGKREGVWTLWDPSGLTSHRQIYKDDQVVR